MSELLVVDSVGKAFGTKQVLKTASIKVESGAIVGLLGRNGCGKSTFLKIAAGRLKPDHGFISFRSRRRAAFTLPRLARRGLFYLSQDSLISRAFPVEDHLHAVSRCFPGAPFLEVVELMRISGLLGRRPSTLSGGELKRVDLALALLRKPRVLLADEPLTGVAPKDRELIHSALARLRDGGAGIVITGHSVASILGLSDEIVWMTGGTTLSLGPPEEARKNFAFRREYLGSAW